MPRSRTAASLLAAATALTALLVAPAAVHTPAASAALAAATATPEATAVELVQRTRASAGRSRLAWASDLGAVAERHAARMAAQRRIFHNPNVGREICCWRAYGENVGTGADVYRVHTAFMGSAGHRANILDRRWHEIGIGVVRGADGRVYEVQIFRQRR